MNSKGDEAEADAAKNGHAAMSKKVRELPEGEGKCILAASLATQEAYGKKEKDHSIFTYHHQVHSTI
jgi:hypothetical protein